MQANVHDERRWGRRIWRSVVPAVGAGAVLAAALPAAAPAMAARQSVPKADPTAVSFTLEGCRNDGTNAKAIRDIGMLLDDYNNSGDETSILIPGSVTIGKADPRAVRDLANLTAGDC